jgi:Spy/CpxP family protein refolding chaperone
MKILKHWKVILAVLLVFAAGAVTGSVLTTFHFKRAFEQALKTEHWTAGAMDFLQKKLNLTPEQQPKIRAITDETVQQFKSSFARAFAESGTNMVACWRRTEQELTPEQRTIYQHENQKFREALKQHFNFELPPQ